MGKRQRQRFGMQKKMVCTVTTVPDRVTSKTTAFSTFSEFYIFLNTVV
jgi:hypothetical protein